jgi:histone H2B
MPPKADKKPAAKAPVASKAPADKKDAGKKTAAPGEKKKRGKTRKETYSSYIYKGACFPTPRRWLEAAPTRSRAAFPFVISH